MKDVAYFIGSCCEESEIEQRSGELLGIYFAELCDAVTERHPQVDVAALEADWRSLYACAWADFHRFLKGWSPDHWKINSYSERLLREVMSLL